MRLNATRLRSDLYKILDRVLETGEPAEIERRGRLLRITPMARPAGVERITPHAERIVGDPDDLVEIGWSQEWRPSGAIVRRRRHPAPRGRS
ncbi:MAG: type II toxin-antitoxin system Phd/YefM family antitoxin [Deltaproteobacteria bacterium]|nr:type II toxin-antitoxin system Phd/YefM family antitoxin [Deltaproteobacteria bacterium]